MVKKNNVQNSNLINPDEKFTEHVQIFLFLMSCNIVSPFQHSPLKQGNPPISLCKIVEVSWLLAIQ